jgi:hypothetical protein
MIPDDTAQLIKLIINNHANQSSIENSQKHESELKAKHGEDELKAKQDVTELRRAWGHTILHLIIFIVIFLICLTVVIGFGRNFFKIEAEVLKIIIVGALAEILGLALIVAKFLFGNQSYKS